MENLIAETLIQFIDKKFKDIKLSKYFCEITENRKLLQNLDNDRYYIKCENYGLEFLFSKSKVLNSIYLKSHNYCKIWEENDEIKQFTGILPRNLKFEMPPEIVHQTLGNPDISGGGGFFVGRIPVWNKYLFENYSLHIQYTEDLSSIELITIMSLSLEYK
jgi:hypothetical protein